MHCEDHTKTHDISREINAILMCMFKNKYIPSSTNLLNTYPVRNPVP